MRARVQVACPGGVTPFSQPPDTNVHAALKRLYIEEGMDCELATSQATPFIEDGMDCD